VDASFVDKDLLSGNGIKGVFVWHLSRARVCDSEGSDSVVSGGDSKLKPTARVILKLF